MLSTQMRHRAGRLPRGRWGITGILCIAIALLGGIVFAYPLAAPWIADAIQAEEIVRYDTESAELDPEVREQLLADAREFNANLPNGPLRDPYIINASGDVVSLEEGRDDYDRQLRIDPGDRDAAMARLTIPTIDVDLPVFHGTSDETLSRGVGHLYGSGLPVGGEGVHSVLTAHTGYVEARLFDDLSKLELGDTFTITVLGERLSYRIDNIATVLPDESELLRQVPGEDYVTLVTCTPRYVNTHRLLVRGIHITTEDVDATGGTSNLRISPPDAGVPWWLLVVLSPPIAAFFLVRPRRLSVATRGDEPHIA